MYLFNTACRPFRPLHLVTRCRLGTTGLYHLERTKAVRHKRYLKKFGEPGYWKRLEGPGAPRRLHRICRRIQRIVFVQAAELGRPAKIKGFCASDKLLAPELSFDIEAVRTWHALFAGLLLSYGRLTRGSPTALTLKEALGVTFLIGCVPRYR